MSASPHCCFRSTEIPQEVFQEYMGDLHGIWTPEAYSLFDNNCNHFTDEVANFLVSAGIPVSLFLTAIYYFGTPQ